MIHFTVAPGKLDASGATTLELTVAAVFHTELVAATWAGVRGAVQPTEPLTQASL